MGASSVTGVGQGSAVGYDKRQKDYTVGANRVLGPRVVAAGQVSLISGAASVVLPLLPESSSNYIVMATDNSGTAAAVSATLTFNVTDTTVGLAGTGTHAVSWAILKPGLAY